MKKWVGWICFFLIVIGLAVGGFFLASSFDADTFEFKEVEIIDYNDYSLNDFVKQDVVCNDKGCKFKDKDVIFTISDIKELGVQDITLKLEYEGENFEKIFHVNVVDKVTPEIVLSEKVIEVNLNETIDETSYISEVKDNYDSLNVEDVAVENLVDLKTPGDYEIIYTVEDSSGNKGKAILKVKVQGEKEVISSIDDKREEVEEEIITLNYNISGLLNDSGTIIQGKTQSLVHKDIEFDWDTTIQFTANIDTNGRIRYIISKNEITGNELTPIGGRGFPVIGGDQVSKNQETSFQYTFTDAGTYYVSIVVFDEDNNIVIKKDFCLNLSVPDEVKDMKITTLDKGSYMVIDCDYIGGGDNTYYFVVTITGSDDPNLDRELLVNEGDEIRLYYTAGYSYEIVGMLVTADEELVMMKTITIQK